MKHLISILICICIITSFFVFSASADNSGNSPISIWFSYQDSSHSSWTQYPYEVSLNDGFIFGQQGYWKLRIDKIRIFRTSNNNLQTFLFKIGSYLEGEESQYSLGRTSHNSHFTLSGDSSIGSTTAYFVDFASGFLDPLDGYTAQGSRSFCGYIYWQSSAGYIDLTFDTYIYLDYSNQKNFKWYFDNVVWTYNYSIALRDIVQLLPTLNQSIINVGNGVSQVYSELTSIKSAQSNFFSNFTNSSYNSFSSSWSNNNFTPSLVQSNWFNSINNNLFTIASETALQHQLQDKVNNHGAEDSYDSFAGQSQFSSITSFSGIQKAANFNSSSLASESTNFLTQWFSQLCKDDIDAVANTRVIGQLDIVDFIGNRKEDDYVESD